MTNTYIRIMQRHIQLSCTLQRMYAQSQQPLSHASDYSLVEWRSQLINAIASALNASNNFKFWRMHGETMWLIMPSSTRCNQLRFGSVASLLPVAKLDLRTLALHTHVCQIQTKAYILLSQVPEVLVNVGQWLRGKSPRPGVWRFIWPPPCCQTLIPKLRMSPDGNWANK